MTDAPEVDGMKPAMPPYCAVVTRGTFPAKAPATLVTAPTPG